MSFGYSRMIGLYIATVSRLDSTTSEQLKEFLDTICTEQSCKVIFDLSGLSQLDTFGLGQIVVANEIVRKTGGKCCWVINPRQEQVRRKFELAGFHKHMLVCDDVSEGLDVLFEGKK